MEGSCPATPLVLAGGDSKSPLQVAISSPESDGMKSPSRDSPDSRCVICLGRLQNKSFTDSCLHQFCFQCLLQWSKVKPECPLCKQPFKSIIHNVRSNLDYDQYHVEHGEPRLVLTDLMHSYNFDLIPVDRAFRYRSTMTREYFRELAESFLAHSRRLHDEPYQIPPLVPLDPAPAPSVRHSQRLHANAVQQRARQRGTSDFRRNVYAQDLWVQDLADISGRYRECTPQFYRENPAQIHRIIPWLNREVNVLLSDCESHAAYVLTRIVSILPQHSIRSREFRELVEPYFGDRTDHFIHELYTFAHSVYDIAGFDQNAVYSTNPNYATEVQEISSSNDDSDIEVLETFKREEKKFKKNSRQGYKKALLKRAEGSESKTDEPVAGPSGIKASRTTESVEVCESDPDDIKVLDYVKPEPEVVTLSSGDEAPAVFSDLDISNGEYAEMVSNEKLSRTRPSSDEDYVLPSERRKNKSKGGKGKCKSNGFGLKGRQKRKYIRSRRCRDSTSSSSSRSSSSSSSSSSTSSNSSRSSSTSSSSSCSRTNSCRSRSVSSTSCSSSEYKPSSKLKKKKSKASRIKYKKKINCRSSCNDSGNKRHNNNKPGDNSIIEVDKNVETKKRVKSCVIVPSSKSCDLSDSPYVVGSSSKFSPQPIWISSDPTYHKRPRSLASYWSTVPNVIKSEKSRKKRDRSSERKSEKSKRKYRKSSSEDRSSKRMRGSSSSSERSSKNSCNIEYVSGCRYSKSEHSSKNSKKSNSKKENSTVISSPPVVESSKSSNLSTAFSTTDTASISVSASSTSSSYSSKSSTSSTSDRSVAVKISSNSSYVNSE